MFIGGAKFRLPQQRREQHIGAGLAVFHRGFLHEIGRTAFEEILELCAACNLLRPE